MNKTKSLHRIYSGWRGAEAMPASPGLVQSRLPLWSVGVCPASRVHRAGAVEMLS